VRITRKAVLSTAGTTYAAAAIARLPAGAAEFSYKLGHDDPPMLSGSVKIAEAAEKIKNETHGRLEILVFPNSQLGNSQNMLSQVRLGAIAFARLSLGDVASAVPGCGLDWLPFAYKNYKAAFDARDGAFGAYMRAQIAKVGLFAFEKMWEHGFRQIYNNVRAINTPKDMTGLKIRSAAIEMQVSFFKAMGASPTPVSINELYPALQTHIVDGGDQPAPSIYQRKIYEVVKYLSVTNHQTTGVVTLANSDAWMHLPAGIRDVVIRNFDAAAVADRNLTVKEEPESFTMLQGKGMLVNTADGDSFRAALRQSGFYGKQRDQYGTEAWNALEKSVGRLA
jgi:tripartite ATP-independent transporter DctP family solute receptor